MTSERRALRPGTGGAGHDAAEQAFATRLFTASIAAAELMTINVGLELGLYELLCAAPMTSDELAVNAGIGERYAREWLEQQAAAGVLDVCDASLPPRERRFLLPPAHRRALVGPGAESSIAPMAVLPVAGIAPVLPKIIGAYREGSGLTYDEYGSAFRAAQTGMNRSVFDRQLAGWVHSALPDLHRRLARQKSVIVDIGCGSGWSSIALAKAYPRAEVHGFDVDPHAIRAAQENALAAGAPETLAFHLGDVVEAASEASEMRATLLCLLDALHDMARPVQVLGCCREMLRPGGSVLLMEPRAAERFTAPASEVERFLYAVSVLHCLPVSMSERPSAATGTVIRPETVRGYARAAGFTSVVELSIDHSVHRLYRLD